MTQIRQHRVDAFAAWLRTAPGSPPFHQQPGFRFFRDLTQPELAAAGEIMRGEGEKLHKAADQIVKTDHHFGGCPTCGCTDGYMNIRSNHFFVCDAHNTAWAAGSNLFSDWHDENQGQWEANEQKLRSMHIVQPVYPAEQEWVR